MKPRLLLLATAVVAASTALSQQPTAAVEPTAAPTPGEPAAAASTQGLTSDQQANVLKQLEELERSIMAQRGTSLGAAIARSAVLPLVMQQP